MLNSSLGSAASGAAGAFLPQDTLNLSTPQTPQSSQQGGAAAAQGGLNAQPQAQGAQGRSGQMSMTLNFNGPGAARFLADAGGPQGLMKQMAAGFMGAMEQMASKGGGMFGPAASGTGQAQAQAQAQAPAGGMQQASAQQGAGQSPGQPQAFPSSAQGFAGNSGWSPFGQQGWTGGNLSPTNAQGQPSSQPADVGSFFKNMFGSFLQHAFSQFQNGGQQASQGQQAPAGGALASAAPAGLTAGGMAPAGNGLQGQAPGAGSVEINLPAQGALASSAPEGGSTSTVSGQPVLQGSGQPPAAAQTPGAGQAMTRTLNFSMAAAGSFTTQSGATPSGKTPDGKTPDGKTPDTAASTVTPNAQPAKPAKADVTDNGQKATVEIGGHKLTFDKSSSQVTIDGGASIEGDPHLLNKDGTVAANFKKDARIVMDDGTKIYASVADKDGKTQPKDSKGATYVDKIAVESPDGKIAFINNLSEKNTSKLTAETMDANPANYNNIAARMQHFDPAASLRLDKKDEHWLNEAGGKIDQATINKAEA